MFSGEDGLLPEFSEIGCDGLVSVASNVWPEETSYIVDQCLKGNVDHIIPDWKQIANSLFVAPNPVPAKVLLKTKKVISTNTVRLPLSIEDLKESDGLTKADKKITNWYKNL